jgi:hypothetical protein
MSSRSRSYGARCERCRARHKPCIRENGDDEPCKSCATVGSRCVNPGIKPRSTSSSKPASLRPRPRPLPSPSLCSLDDDSLDRFYRENNEPEDLEETGISVPRPVVSAPALMFSGLAVPPNFSLQRALAEIEDLIVKGSLVHLGGLCMPSRLPTYLWLAPNKDMVKAVNGRTAVRSLAIDVLSVPPSQSHGQVGFLDTEEGERCSVALLQGTRFQSGPGDRSWRDLWVDLVDPEFVLLPSEAAAIIINIIKARKEARLPGAAQSAGRVKTFNRVQAAIFSLPAEQKRNQEAPAEDGGSKRWFAKEEDAMALERTERETLKRVNSRQAQPSLAEIDGLVDQFCEIAVQELKKS